MNIHSGNNDCMTRVANIGELQTETKLTNTLHQNSVIASRFLLHQRRLKRKVFTILQEN